MVRGQNEDESALIYGLESQARSLAPGPSGEGDLLVRFIVGTQSLKSDNFVHLLEYVEENHSLSKSIVRHPVGEVWGLCSSNRHCQLLVTCHSKPSPDQENQITSGCTLWKIPVDMSSSLVDEDGRNEQSPSLEKLCDLSPEGKIGRSVVLKPEDEDHLINFSEDKIFLWNIDSHQLVSELPIGGKSKLSKISTVRWSPHSNGNIVGAGIGSSVCGVDIRQKPTSFPWTVNTQNCLVRDLDFNPNAQYFLATCGDDFQSRFWDLRKPETPIVSLLNHSHWIWSIRYNQFHDQLVLTCSSDSRVVLSRIATLASQPFGHLLEEEDPSSDDDVQQSKKKEEPVDEVIATFEEHEDSVYAAEWSSSDPWIFASLSVDGRLVINKVPKNEKFSILF